ncbi:hypothetical protein [Chromobacterium violaceum]|uniref:hypothetical protein n=1 Tax=Chromobacterium violaceum TaxID=536 RepID=UPI001B2FE71F|nr:hypothetical protein [Chromobacterium violaceum]
MRALEYGLAIIAGPFTFHGPPFPLGAAQRNCHSSEEKMANLQEKPFWEPGIYQLETSDPVLAGPDGIDNLQGKQLANRTVHLKERVDKLESGEQPSGNAAKLSAARKIEATGDGSWNVVFDGSRDVSGPLTLRDSGVAPGNYGQVTVDAKGRVTAARAIQAGDVPALDWSKIVSGKPTTLAGYGIADGVSKTELASNLDSSRTLRNVEYLKVTSTSGAVGRLAGINASNQMFIGDIDGVANLLSLQVAGVGVASATKDGLQLNGTPTVPTPAANAGGQQAANVAYVKSAIDGVVAGAPGALNTLKELADALGSDGNFAATVTNKLAGKADKATTLAGYGIVDGITVDRMTRKNLVRDSGRFISLDVVYDNPFSVAFNNQFALSPLTQPSYAQSVTIASAGKFIHDNTTNGGGGGELAAPVKELLAAFPTRKNFRYGSEFYVAELNCGALNFSPDVVDGIRRCPAAAYGALTEGNITFMLWLRCKKGSVLLDVASYKNGKPTSNPIVTPADGWVHCAGIANWSGGYSIAHIRAEDNSVFQVAMPAALSGNHLGYVHEAPISF